MEKLIEKLNKIDIKDAEIFFKEWSKGSVKRIYVNIKNGKRYNTIGYIENNQFTLTNKKINDEILNELEKTIEEILSTQEFLEPSCVAEDTNFPALVGTEKQIRWATDIRFIFILTLDFLEECIKYVKKIDSIEDNGVKVNALYRVHKQNEGILEDIEIAKKQILTILENNEASYFIKRYYCETYRLEDCKYYLNKLKERNSAIKDVNTEKELYEALWLIININHAIVEQIKLIKNRYA